MNFAIFIFLIAGLMVIGEAVKEVKNPLALVLIILGTSLFLCIGPVFTETHSCIRSPRQRIPPLETTVNRRVRNCIQHPSRNARYKKGNSGKTILKQPDFRGFPGDCLGNADPVKAESRDKEITNLAGI